MRVMSHVPAIQYRPRLADVTIDPDAKTTITALIVLLGAYITPHSWYCTYNIILVY